MMNPVAETTEGPVRGRHEGSQAVFTGVPYARTGSGTDRFAAPRPPRDHPRSIQDTSGVAAACPQLPSPFSTLFGDPDERQDENCLTVNIWTPGTDGGRRPVLVWLHGGSYLTGSGSIPRYDGAELAAEQDVVVVLVTYRIGVLGFPPFADTAVSSSPAALTAPSTDAAIRNVGAWDLLAALRWIQRNAAAFGGDPDGICALGQSAGAQLLAALLTLPEATQMLSGAVLHSPPLGLPPVSDDGGHSREFAAATGATTAAQARRLDIATLLRGQAAMLRAASVRRELAPPVRLVADPVLAPVAEGGVPLVQAPPAAPIPLLVTTTRDECSLWLNDSTPIADEALASAVSDVVGVDCASEAIARYRDAGAASATEILAALQTDATFSAPAERYADAARQSGCDVQLARFDLPSRGSGRSLGAAHCIDIPFILGGPQARRAPLVSGWDTNHLAAVRHRIRTAWSRFARDGTHLVPTSGVREPALPAVLLGEDAVTTADSLLAPAVRALWA